MKETKFKDTEVGRIPEDWEVKPIKQTCIVKRGVRVTRRMLTAVGNYPVYQNTDYPLGFYNHYNVEANTPFVIVGGSAGLIGRCNVKYWAADDCAYFTNLNGIIKDFLYYELLYLHNEIKKEVRTASIPRLDRTVIENLLMVVPPKFEQSRIATALSTIDNLISELGKLIEKKRAIKQGAMQQLLTGKKHLKGFTEPWVEKTLKEICSFQNGYTPSKAINGFWENGTIPWFRMEDIRTDGRILADSIQHITEEAVKSSLFPAGSIIMSTTATIGEHALLIVDSLANQQFTNLAIRKSLTQAVDTMWLYHYCFVLGEWCRNNINEGGLAAVNMEDFSNVIIPLPSFDEQQAIASVLTSMDKEISAIEAKKAKYETIKQGMMRQLLTGKIRLI